MYNCNGCDRCLNFDWERKVLSEDGDEPGKKRKRIQSKKISDVRDLSDTVLETARYYEAGKKPEAIAKIRSLGLRTIMNHLADWYQAGGAFEYEKYVSPSVQEKVLSILERTGSEKLSPIKKALPASISYDQIKFVIAHKNRVERLSM